MRALVALFVTLGLSLPAAAQSKPPLREVAEIDNGLMAVAIALEISEECDDIGARYLRGVGTLSALKSQARSLGYSDEEIEDYVTSKSEKARMRRKAESYLEGQGVDAKDNDQLCAYGRGEIQKNSPVGRLLR